MAPFLREVIVMLNEMAIYLLLGFLLSGLLHAFLQRRSGFLRPLEGPGAKPVFMAALIGVPLSLCSCSVLPTGVQLMRRGVRKGTAASFLITVPETDIVSVFLTYGMIGPVLAVFRPVAALITGISAGLLINVVDRHRPRSIERPMEAAPNSCGDGCCAEQDSRSRGFLPEALQYGFVEFFDDLLLRLLLGILIGAAIAALVPASSLTHFAGNTVLSYLAMLALGVPLFVCASASIPIAAGLIASGFSPGATLVFLLAGPATNVASILVLAKQFGRLVFAIYLAMISFVAVGMGLLLDFLIHRRLLPPPDFSRLVNGESTTLGLIGTLLFLGLAVWSLWRRRMDRRFLAWVERRFGLRLRPQTLGRIAVASALLIWLGSGCFAVRPGERAVVSCFGAITSENLGPGLHYHWPAPFGRAHRAVVGGIRRVELGFRSAPAIGSDLPAAAQDEGAVKPGQPAVHGSPTESWMLTGDENIVDLQAVVQYQVQDSPRAVRAFLFAVEDPDRLVRATALWALQESVGGRGIDSLLTADRAGVERQVRDRLMQPALDAWGTGIRIVDFRLVSVHAPTPVHWAFRDVAGAAEDAVNAVNRAHEYTERILREAEGDSARGVLLARGQAVERVRVAEGEASAFLAQSGEYRKSPGVTRSRLYLEKLDAVLPGMNLYLDLTGSRGQGPSIWIKRGTGYEGLPFAGSSGTAAGGSGSGSPGTGASGTGENDTRREERQ